jgi:hypothetical protein
MTDEVKVDPLFYASVEPHEKKALKRFESVIVDVLRRNNVQSIRPMWYGRTDNHKRFMQLCMSYHLQPRVLLELPFSELDHLSADALRLRLEVSLRPP